MKKNLSPIPTHNPFIIKLETGHCGKHLICKEGYYNRKTKHFFTFQGNLKHCSLRDAGKELYISLFDSIVLFWSALSVSVWDHLIKRNPNIRLDLFSDGAF